MSETNLPNGHIRHGGREYVAIELFEAACRHVTEQGEYHNTLIATLNEQGRDIRKLERQLVIREDELADVRRELLATQANLSALRESVYKAAEYV